MTWLKPLAVLLSSAGEIAVLLLLTAGATAKLVDFRPTFEIVETVTGSPWAGAAVLTLVLCLEVGLATALWLGLLRGLPALICGLVVLALFSIWLLYARNVVGGAAECGCLTALRRGSIGNALLGNAILAGELAIAIVAQRFVCRRT